MVSASKSYRNSPSSTPGRAELQYPTSVNAMLLPLCGELINDGIGGRSKIIILSDYRLLLQLRSPGA